MLTAIRMDDLIQWLSFPLLYDEGLIKWVDEKAKVHTATSYGELVSKLPDCTIKIEGVERISVSAYDQTVKIREKLGHKGPVTCHLFWAQKGSHSFPMHTDPYDVHLEVVYGVKHMVTELEDSGYLSTIELNSTAAERFIIPAGKIHRAVNNEASIMLSYSPEGFLEDRLDVT